MEKEEKVVKKSGKKLINIFLIIIILLISLVIYARYVGVKGLVVYEYKIASEKIPSSFNGIKIIHFSDILYKSTFYEEDLLNLVERINELKPDIVVFTGGLINEGVKLNEEEMKNLSKELKKIKSTTGKYAVKGDEDGDDFESIMDDASFTILENSGEFIYNKGLTPIYIGGFASSIKSSVNVEATFEKIDMDVNKDVYFKILLMHEGDSTRSLLSSRSDVDVIMAGNSLNGSVVIPFYGGVYIPNGSKTYNEKYYKEGSTEIFVSSGLGTKKFNYRFRNKPSFNFYRLKSL